MRAVLCKTLDGPDSLEVDGIPGASPGAGEVSIRVAAAALNFFDTLITRGRYQQRPPLPFSPGGEIAGTILKVGEGVTGLAVGQRVLGYIGWNGCREEAIASSKIVIPLPVQVSDEAAAAIPITYGTALHGLEDRGRLKAGETLLVLGATGGAGLAAVEVGVRMGARVIAAGTSDEKLKICIEHGASDVINLTGADVKDAVRSLTNGKGVDVVYDCIGGPYAEPALRAIAWGGRYLVIGFAAGDIPKIPLNLLLLKGCELVGVFWGRHVELEPAAFRTQMEKLLGWCAKGEIRPHIDRVFPLEETGKALSLIEKREIKGKVVIKP